jgi:hypothetical protein
VTRTSLTLWLIVTAAVASLALGEDLRDLAVASEGRTVWKSSVPPPRLVVFEEFSRPT